VKIIITARCNVLFRSVVLKIQVFGHVTPSQQLFHQDEEITLTQNVVNYLPRKNLGFRSGESSRTYEVLHDVSR
jgi:hypothetical protein